MSRLADSIREKLEAGMGDDQFMRVDTAVFLLKCYTGSEYTLDQAKEICITLGFGVGDGFVYVPVLERAH